MTGKIQPRECVTGQLELFLANAIEHLLGIVKKLETLESVALHSVIYFTLSPLELYILRKFA